MFELLGVHIIIVRVQQTQFTDRGITRQDNVQTYRASMLFMDHLACIGI